MARIESLGDVGGYILWVYCIAEGEPKGGGGAGGISGESGSRGCSRVAAL